MNAWKPPVSSWRLADPHQVVDPLFHRLDVAVEHRDVGAHAQSVRRAMDRRVAIAVALVVADLAAHALGENLGAAARQRIETGLAELDQHLLVGHAVEIGEERDLDRREALQMHVRPDRLEPAQQILVVVERQLRDAGR